MRRYRETMRQLQSNAHQVALWSCVWMRDNIIALIREKYEPSDNVLHRLVDALYDLIKLECPQNTPDERERMIDVHLLHYYHLDLLPAIFAGAEHPSLVPDLVKRLKELEPEG